MVHFGYAPSQMIVSCPLKKEYGKHLVEEELQSLINALNAGQGLQHLPHLQKGH
jgi:hypothetical protein